MICIVSDFKLFPTYPHFRWKSSLAFLWKSHQIFLPSNDENNFFFLPEAHFGFISLVQKTNSILSYIIYAISSSLSISPFLFKCLNLQLKEKMKAESPKPFSFLSWASESLYRCSVGFFFLMILFMAKWIRNNKYQLVDLISLVRSHIWYLLQENSIFSNLLCQAYITHSRQSLVTNAHFSFLTSRTEFLIPTTACEYSSLFCKTASLPLSWPWLTIQNAFCVPPGTYE